MSELKSAFSPTKVEKIIPIGDVILVSDMAFDNRTLNSGIVLLNDNMKSQGIRPRWAKVYAVGPDQDITTVGKWILISHGRWSRGITIEDSNGEQTIRRVDPNDILLESDTLPIDETLSDKATG